MPLTAIILPYIDPVLLHVGPFSLRWYSIAYILGILFAWFYGIRIANNPKLFLSPIHASAKNPPENILLFATIGIILGGRIGYVLFYNPFFYIENPMQIFAVWNGGMAFHGGMLGLILGIWLSCRQNGLPFLFVMDIVAVLTPVGLFLGRIGNFINAEIPGVPSNVPWAVIFIGDNGISRHPSQLYEAALEGLLLFTILHFLTSRYKALSWPGMISGCFLLGYGLVRIFAEFFRMPDEQIGYLWDHLTMGILLSSPLIPMGIFLIIRAFQKGPRIKWTAGQ